MESNENKNIDNEELFIKKDHRALKAFIIITTILLILSGLSFIFYYKYYNKPMIVIGNIINNSKKSFNKLSKETDDIYKVNGSFDVNLNFKDQQLQDIGNIINNIKLQYDLSVNNIDEYGIFKINTKYQDDKLINFNSVIDIKEQYFYLYLEDIYNKYLKTTININENSEIKEQINYNIIINGICESLTDAFKEEDFERKKGKISVKDKLINVSRNSLVINSNNYKRIMTSILNKLINNQEFINEIDKINQEKTTKDKLNNLLENLNKEEFKDIIKINFYTKLNLKQDLIKIEITRITEEQESIIEIDQLNDNEFVIRLIGDNKELANITIKNNTNNNMLINLELMDEDVNIKLSFNMAYEKLKKLEKLDTTENIDIDNLSEKETNEIVTKLLENKAITEIINDFSKIFSQGI